MSYAFIPAKREQIGLLIGLVGGTGAGKTKTALELASGIAGDKPFAFIDTENRRGLHYADEYRFDHLDLRAPFRPDNYINAILAADKAGYPVIVVDSMSHVWAGDGGILDWQDDELDRMAGDDWKKREACKMAAWIKPKMAHKRMVQQMLQVRAHVILCFRAEEKVEIVREDGKTKIVPKQSLTGHGGWIPICDKNLPFELTCSLLFTADRPGMPTPIKLQSQHREMFPLDRPVTRESGQRIALWAAGGAGDSGIADHLEKGREAAKSGIAALKTWWSAVPAHLQPALRSTLEGELQPAAKSVSQSRKALELQSIADQANAFIAEGDLQGAVDFIKSKSLAAPQQEFLIGLLPIANRDTIKTMLKE